MSSLRIASLKRHLFRDGAKGKEIAKNNVGFHHAGQAAGEYVKTIRGVSLPMTVRTEDVVRFTKNIVMHVFFGRKLTLLSICQSEVRTPLNGAKGISVDLELKAIAGAAVAV